MNLLFAIVILFSLIWGQICIPAEPKSLSAVIGKAALLGTIAPAFAAFQVWLFRWRHATKPAKFRSKLFRAMAITHCIVWTVLSIAIIAWVRWVDVALLIPQSIPLVDELILVAPALISLIGSWAIFIFGLPGNTITSSKSRTSLFGVWLRLQVLMVVAPVLFAFFVSDCVILAASVSFSPAAQTAFWIVAGLLILGAVLLYPGLMLLIWSTRKIEDPAQVSRFKKLFQNAGLRPRSVRVWQTNETIVNAAAIGIVPGTEVIVVSDLLLKTFDQQEVDAILLHEMGHVRHLHCVKRIAMVIVPLACLAADQTLGLGLHSSISQSEFLVSLFGSLTQYLPAVVFLIYLWLITKTVFRSMEYEADRFATKTLFQMGESHAVPLALEKMAVIYPRLADKRSGLHPSVRQRLAHVLEVESQLAGEAKQDTLIDPTDAPKGISLDPIAAK